MKTAIIIHGWPSREEFFDSSIPSPSNNQWLPWLQKQLGMKGWNVQTPEMPDAYEPSYEKWKSVFEQFHLDENTTLVGHSCGAGFLLRWLSENKIKVGTVFLIAPWIDPAHKEREYIGDFFDFEIDSSLIDRTDGVIIFVSNDDEESVIKTVEIVDGALKNALIKHFANKGHFTLDDMGTNEFPELLEECIRI